MDEWNGVSHLAVNATSSFGAGNSSIHNPTPEGARLFGVSDLLATPLFYGCLTLIVITAVWSVRYLNSAMQLFGNTQVVPVYYCTFTLCSVVGAAVVFDEMDCLTLRSALMFGGGCVAAALGVFFVTSGTHAEGHGLPADQMMTVRGHHPLLTAHARCLGDSSRARPLARSRTRSRSLTRALRTPLATPSRTRC